LKVMLMSFSKSNPVPFLFTENGVVLGIAAFSFLSLSIWAKSREKEEKRRLMEDEKLKLNKIRKDLTAEQDAEDEFPVSRKGHDPQKSPRTNPTPRKGQENLHQMPSIAAGFKLPAYHVIMKLRKTNQQIREIEQLINRRKQDIEEQKMDKNVLEKRLQAEEQLRKEAEHKSSMIQIELERLQRKLSKHNVECLNLQQTLTAYNIDLELRRASMDAGDESAKKVQKLVSTLRDEHQLTKSEMLQLRDTNKTLLHKSAHDLNQRDQLLRQITDLKKQVKELKAASKAIESDQYEQLSDHNTPRGHFDLTFSTDKHRTIEDGDEEDEDVVDIIPNATDNNDNNDENDDELASDRFLRLYERHQTPRTTSW